MRQRDVAALVADPGMTPDAVRVVLHVAFKGESAWHPIAPDEFSELLEEGAGKRIKKAIERAMRRGYLRVQEGRGRGNHSKFQASVVPSIGPEENPSHGEPFSDKTPPTRGGFSPENPSHGDTFSGGALYGGVNPNNVVSKQQLAAVVEAREANGNGNGVDPETLGPWDLALQVAKVANQAMRTNPTVAPGVADMPRIDAGKAEIAVKAWLAKGIRPTTILRAVEQAGSRFQADSSNPIIGSIAYYNRPVEQEHARVLVGGAPDVAIPRAPDPVTQPSRTISPPTSAAARDRYVEDFETRFAASAATPRIPQSAAK